MKNKALISLSKVCCQISQTLDQQITVIMYGNQQFPFIKLKTILKLSIHRPSQFEFPQISKHQIFLEGSILLLTFINYGTNTMVEINAMKNEFSPNQEIMTHRPSERPTDQPTTDRPSKRQINRRTPSTSTTTTLTTSTTTPST